MPPDHWANIEVISDECAHSDLYVESSLRLPEGREYCVPRVLVSGEDEVPKFIPVLNLSRQELQFKPGMVLARGIPCVPEVQPRQEVLQVTDVSLPPISDEEVDSGSISDVEKQQLVELINKYRVCFSTGLTDLGCAKSTEMNIQLNDAEPFTYRPYRMALKEKEIVDEMVGDLLENDIVRPSDSPYASPVLLVKKKNGESRLCIDYRKLNSKTVKDRYPLPRIDDQIDRLHGSKYYTSLDLRSGYYQLPMAESAKKYTAFVTPSEQYEFNRMPFGLANAPSCFSRLMNRVLGPARNIAAIYLDDILIHTSTIAEGLKNLEAILKLLQQERLTLNLSKCSFLKTTVTYLGYDIEDGAVKPGRSKTQAVEDFPSPQNVHQVRQFLGLTGYFRHFIRNHAQIAKNSFIEEGCDVALGPRSGKRF